MNNPFYGTSAKLRIIPGICQPLNSLVGNLDGNTIVFQHLLYSIELQTYNIHDFRLLQRGEHDDFVDTVQELRANRLFQHFVYLVIRLVKYLIPVILVDALQTFLNDMCTDIRSHDDNRIFEIDYPTFIIS